MAEGTGKETAGGEKERDVALFKFSLIAPVVAGTFTQATKMDYYRETCEKEHRFPDGRAVKLSPLTLKKWYWLYTDGGLEALLPKACIDQGLPRVLSKEEAHNIIQTRTNLYQEAIDKGLVDNLPLNHDTRLAAHSEVRAFDLALKAREEAGIVVDEMTISDLFLYNIDMIKFFKGKGLVPKDRCENCKIITKGIHVIRHE